MKHGVLSCNASTTGNPAAAQIRATCQVDHESRRRRRTRPYQVNLDIQRVRTI